MGQTIRYQLVADCMILVHGERAPARDEWDAYVETLAQWLGATSRVLVVTDDTGPDSVQRARVNDAVTRHGSPVPTAVMTRSRVARGIVTALGWFNPSIRAFAPTALTDALGYLRVDLAQRAAFLQQITRMRIELAAPEDAARLTDGALPPAQLEVLMGMPLALLRGALPPVAP